MIGLINEARIQAGGKPMGFLNVSLPPCRIPCMCHRLHKLSACLSSLYPIHAQLWWAWQPFIYKNTAAFTDIVKGNNAIGRGQFTLPYGFNCTKGWDPITGVPA